MMTGQETSMANPGKLYVISAPSGSGKTSLARALLARMAAQGRRARFSISYTTRARRAGEQQGVDYHFISDDEFEAMIQRDEFLEYAWVFDRYYGTAVADAQRWQAAGQDVVLDIDWQGAAQVRTKAPEAVTIFIQPPSREELERRLRSRGSEDEESIQRRLAEADREMAHADEYDYQIVNDTFDRALMDLAAIFEKTGN